MKMILKQINKDERIVLKASLIAGEPRYHLQERNFWIWGTISMEFVSNLKGMSEKGIIEYLYKKADLREYYDIARKTFGRL